MTDAGRSVSFDDPTTGGRGSRPAVPLPVWILGAIALAVGLASSGWLSADAINVFGKLPGCAEGAGCAEAANSKFGALPFTDVESQRIIPVSLLGFGFVFAMSAMWVHALVRGASALVPWFAGAGAFVSTMYLGIIVANADSYLCPFCIASHAANLVFFLVACLSQAWRLPRLTGAFGTLASSGAAFVVATGVLFGVYQSVDRAHAAQQRAQQNDFVQGLLNEQPTPATPDSGDTFQPIDPAEFDSFQPVDPTQVEVQGPDARRPAACDGAEFVVAPAWWPIDAAGGATAGTNAIWLPAQADMGPAQPRTIDEMLAGAAPVRTNGFIGRYLEGPAQAHARIIMVSSFQCPACIRKHAEIVRLMDEFPDRVNYSIIHYPLHWDCNPSIEQKGPDDRPPHANGCWAARAAEAAGILGGEPAFVRMSKWLYEKEGTFRGAQELFPIIDELGLNRAEFFTAMQSDETLERVREDATYAKQELGVFQTPTIYVNGRELKAWGRPDAVYDTVTQLLEGFEGRPMMSNAIDQPAGATQKLVDDFLQHRLAQINYAPRLRVPNTNHRGPEDAGMVITMTGGVTRESTWRMHARLQAALELLPDDFPAIRWEYRHDPLHSACDPQMQQNIEQARQQAIREGRNPADIKDLVPDGTCDIHFTLQALAELAGPGPFFDTLWWTLEREGELTNDDLIGHIVATYPQVTEEVLVAKAGESGVRDQVVTEGALGRTMRNGSPVLYLNGQYVPPTSWGSTDPQVLRQILMHKAGMRDQI
ncbi:MAG: thioredoxin domain-containing protein [Planctomycetota bacterium]